jgi:hypothetical protein
MPQVIRLLVVVGARLQILPHTLLDGLDQRVQRLIQAARQHPGGG